MSVVGIDFGNNSSVVAVAQRGGIDIILNEAMNRATPYLSLFKHLLRLTLHLHFSHKSTKEYTFSFFLHY
jgi:hypothetical protein